MHIIKPYIFKKPRPCAFLHPLTKKESLGLCYGYLDLIEALIETETGKPLYIKIFNITQFLDVPEKEKEEPVQ